MHTELVTKDLENIWHPFTPQKESTAPILIARGEGAFLFDSEGVGYLDATSSWWVNLHGHAHPYIAEKLYEQARKLEHVIFAGFTHEPAIQLATRLLDILPGSFSKIFYSDNGSTSVEVALKMAVQYWWNREYTNGVQKVKRNKILALNNSYHGDTFGAMSVSDRNIFTLAFQDFLFEVIFVEPPLPENTQRTLDLIRKQGDEIACFIYEPLVQGAGGMNMYPAESLNQVLNMARQKGILCIADEVMTGFGRTGELFASENIDTKPDIICLSKGLTGGTMALGVTACHARVHEAFLNDDSRKTFFHGHSFTANPLACAAALASLDLLLDSTCKMNRRRIESQHKTFIQSLSEDKRYTGLPVKNLRYKGTLLAFEISVGKDHYLNEVARQVTRKALDRGIYLRPLGNTLYIMPPYCISREDLDQIYDAIIELLREFNQEN